MKNSQLNKRYTIVALSALVVLLLGIAGTALIHMQNGGTVFGWSLFPEKVIADKNDGINYNPPTDEEIKEGQNIKKESIDKDLGQKNNQQKTSTAQVGIANVYKNTNSGNLEVRAFTPTVIEPDGKCVAILTNGSSSVKGESVAFIDASTSQCKPIIIPLVSLEGSTKWSLTVTYSSPKYVGTSPALEVSL